MKILLSMSSYILSTNWMAVQMEFLNFVGHEYVRPWLQLIHQEIGNILANKSDIDPYGATNGAPRGMPGYFPTLAAIVT